MAEKNLTYEQEKHVESHAALYLRVWAVLLVLTLMEYAYASFGEKSFLMLVLGLMFLAVIKAGLVGWFFMHLKFEGTWVYYMLVPACFLVMVFIGALYPDIGMQQPVVPDYSSEEEALTAPLHPGPAAAFRA
ncbi:MAG TPA: cytochrome C oxidase subunit IV family protein [Isosphaeraceae bacterium]|jgi:cytochrome c oxidase subunit 4|nr:cytochrome C oxidase subunit IV family protein [Isosphaeraceae bacterium]